MKAWIENGRIFATNLDINIPYEVFEFPNDTKLEHLKIVNGRIVLKSQNEIEAELFEKLKKQKLEEFKSKSRQIENSIIGKYPDSERLSWPYKVEEAKRILNNDFTNCHFIRKELFYELNRDPTNEEIINRANLIMNKYNEFHNICSKIISIRRKIENANSIEELNLIDIENDL